MPNTKIYLNVPYAEKDAAKALGARWDAAQKKWYAPDSADIMQFSKWHTPADDTAATSTPKNTLSPTAKTSSGILTQPTIKDFVAYNGEAPPWD